MSQTQKRVSWALGFMICDAGLAQANRLPSFFLVIYLALGFVISVGGQKLGGGWGRVLPSRGASV